MPNTTNSNKTKVQLRTLAGKNVINNIIIAIALICGQWSMVKAQEPAIDNDLIVYSLVARDATGNILANQNISLRFSIHDDQPNGTIVYRETLNTTTTILGLVSHGIGSGTPVIGTIAGLNWAIHDKYLQVEMDATGGTSYVDMGTIELQAVPYAKYAGIAGKAIGSVNYAGTWDVNTNTPDLSSANPDKGDYYVVIITGLTSLGGITDWNVGDWAIYNGTAWEKVDNTDGVTDAQDVTFTPTPAILAINVQDAIDELQLDFTNSIESYVNKIDDGVAIYLPPGGTYKRFGLGGETAPASPLGIKGEPGQDDEMITMTSADLLNKWNINLNPTGNDVDGFSIDNTTSGTAISRLFIDQTNQGNVGIGTVTPASKLHVQGANDGGNVSIMVENLESGTGTGWLMSAIEDNAIAARQNTFAIHEKNGSSLLERITVLPTTANSIKNVGINEVLPYATLHVTKPAADPTEPVSLAENTGILCLGQIDDNNLAMDSRQIQARQGTYIGTQLNITVSTLKLQPLGGGLTINGSMAPPQQATITTSGMLGLGTITPAEKIDIDGAIKIGTSLAANDGTIRYTGTDFEGRVSSAWVSLTGGAGMWTNAGTDKITYNPVDAKVGIGVAVPTATLDIDDTETVTGGNTAVNIHNSSTTSSSSNNRVGLGINCSGVWSPNPSALNIGLRVSNVTGQSNSNANIGALINGNVVIGDITTSDLIGTNGTKVLAIQNGTAPSSAISGSGLAADGGIQLYSQSDAMGTSTFNVMNGDGTIIKLFRAAALTPASNIPVSPVYDPAVQALIENMRNRINELEGKLQTLGLLN